MYRVVVRKNTVFYVILMNVYNLQKMFLDIFLGTAK